MRLFVGEPVWTPYNRPQDKHASRLKYLAQFGKKDEDPEPKRQKVAADDAIL